MYEACSREYHIILRDGRGEHHISADEEDIAHLQNNGEDITILEELPRREEIDVSYMIPIRSQDDQH